MCAAISRNRVISHNATIGPYNTACLLVFLDSMYDSLIFTEEKVLEGSELTSFVIVWDNVSFHLSALVQGWF
ncbi:UNVERIFIED_CONTAM: hypothetical protein FKN15_020740 [Acipenser sinensis]